jgi:hypothetical protein
MGDIGWLVERDGKWWGPQCSEWQWERWWDTSPDDGEPPLWTDDANKALRFARQEDAEAFIRWRGLGGGVGATEHLWVDDRTDTEE